MDKARILKTAQKTWGVSITCLVVPIIITTFLTSQLHPHIPGTRNKSFHYFFSCVLWQTYFAVVAIIFSFTLNSKGVIKLLMVSQWRIRKFVDEQTLSIIVLSNTLVTAIVTPVMSIYYKPKTRIEASASIEQRVRTLQKTPLKGELRILCGIHCEYSVNNIIALLKASNPTEISPICAYVVHLVELIGQAPPLVAPYNIQKQRLKPNSTNRIMGAVTKQTKSFTASVTIQPFAVIAPYNTMHECVCKLADEKFVPFILLPFHKNQEFDKKTASLRQFNLNIQANATCTVGILVDRGLPRYLSSTRLTYNVAVFFFGGADDREAMALVSRMASHPNLSITVFKIEFKGNGKENEREKQLNDYVMNDFIERNIGNAYVVCREVVAYDSRQLIQAVRSMENDYDLAIVGKRQWFNAELEQEMETWVVYEELGIIGYMLASVDIRHAGMMSVLAVQSIRSASESVSSTNVSFRDERNSLLFSSPNSRRDDKDNIKVTF